MRREKSPSLPSFRYSEGLLVQNHEALTDIYRHANGPTNSPFTDKTASAARALAEGVNEQEAHGISLVRVTGDADGRWQVDRQFAGNTPARDTEFTIAGPGARASQMITQLSLAGSRATPPTAPAPQPSPSRASTAVTSAPERRRPSPLSQRDMPRDATGAASRAATCRSHAGADRWLGRCGAKGGRRGVARRPVAPWQLPCRL